MIVVSGKVKIDSDRIEFLRPHLVTWRKALSDVLISRDIKAAELKDVKEV